MQRRKNFYDFCNVLHRYKRPVKLYEILQVVTNEGWYTDFRRLGYNTVARQINNHNEKYGGTFMLPYDNPWEEFCEY